MRARNARSCGEILTIIRLHLAIYFLLHRGQFIGKHCKLARLAKGANRGHVGFLEFHWYQRIRFRPDAQYF